MKARNWLKFNRIKAFYAQVDEVTFEEGAKSLMQATGLGKLRPNVLLMGYKNKWTSSLKKDVDMYFNTIQYVICSCQIVSPCVVIRVSHPIFTFFCFAAKRWIVISQFASCGSRLVWIFPIWKWITSRLVRWCRDPAWNTSSEMYLTNLFVSISEIIPAFGVVSLVLKHNRKIGVSVFSWSRKRRWKWSQEVWRL